MEYNRGSSGGSSSWEKRKASDDSTTSKIPGFETQVFFPSAPAYSRSDDYCPYSIRESQLSTEYQYDILLVYDPEENSYYVEKLMEYLRPENLKIFDFARDAPPGLPQRKVLQSALHHCRYTCIVITRKFISDFWLQLRTDMSIQDMLDNEQKMYSVIIVVMDATVKRTDLPLDLATLSPLFVTERFFENRIKLAFSKTSLLPPLSLSSKNSNEQDPPKYNDVPTTSSVPAPALSTKKPVNNPNILRQSHSRLPTEHGDGTFVMPSSIFHNSVPVTFELPCSMQRTPSITVSSTGLRHPQETLDSACKGTSPSNSSDQNESLDSITKAKRFFSNDSSTESSNKLSSNTEGLHASHTYKEGNFSFLNLPDPEDDNARNQTIRPHLDFETPTFFSVNEQSFVDGEFSELEISNLSPMPSPSSTPSKDAPPLRCHSMVSDQQVESVDEINLPRLPDDDSCNSMPANFDRSLSGLDKSKKSRSLRSLIGLRFSQMSRTLSFRRKQK